MFFDCHIHSDFSFDSKMKLDEIAKTRDNLNIGVITTDHVDLNLDFIPKIDMNNFYKSFNSIRKDNFLVGLEIGLYRENPSEILDFINKEKDNLDFILGSIHTLQGKDLYFSLKEKKRNKLTVYREYLEEMLFCINKFNFFHSLSHIDYICRYAPYEDSELYLNDFKDLFKEIFDKLIKNNKVLELNTNRLGNEKSFNNLVEIYSYYQSLGGKYITIGSDAHSAKDIGRNFALLENFLEKTNLKAIYFKKGHLIEIS
ncbi:MAG: histidinol-phosphatase HisJ family protein [Sarcina sp.]